MEDDFTKSARRVPDTEKVIKQTRGGSLRKEPKMAYKKPEIVAKSEAKQSFVAGCPTSNVNQGDCSNPVVRNRCQMGRCH